MMHIQDMVSEWLGRAISWMCLSMVLVLCWEVLSRYVFGKPTSWAHESSTMLYGSYCLLAGAYTQRFREHVRSDAVYRLFSRRVRAGLDCFGDLLAIGFLAVFLWYSSEFAWTSWIEREFSHRSTWAPPLYPIKATIPLAVLLLLLQFMCTLIDDILILMNIKTDRET